MSLDTNNTQNKIVDDITKNNTSNTENNIKATSSTIKYKGTVTVKYVDKKGRVKRVQQGHNAGEQGLFTCITKALCGYDISPYIPNAIMGYYKINDSDEKALTGEVSMTSTPVIYNSLGIKTDNEGISVQFSFLIPNTYIMPPSSGVALPIKKLCLVNNQYNSTRTEDSNPSYSVCATFEYGDNDTGILTDTGHNIVVYWIMNFSNISDSTSTANE